METFKFSLLYIVLNLLHTKHVPIRNKIEIKGRNYVLKDEGFGERLCLINN
jgi:hypothetical protein